MSLKNWFRLFFLDIHIQDPDLTTDGYQRQFNQGWRGYRRKQE